MEAVSDAVYVVQRFLDAYNARDIEAFIGQLAENVIVEDDSTPTLHGAAAMRDLYTMLFTRDSNQNSMLIGRMVLGPYVIDKEYITGRRAEPFCTMALYRVEGGKIVYMRLLREAVTADPFAQAE